jgi:hypothetical protein
MVDAVIVGGGGGGGGGTSDASGGGGGGGAGGQVKRLRSQTISATSTIITTISKEEYPELKKTKFIAWKTEFNTYNLPQKNTWYSNYTLKINTLGTFEYRMHL